jgi:hypothetical protein
LRSETTSPLAIRSPAASASSNSACCALGKCEPKTSADVVPLAASARTKRCAVRRAWPVSAIFASSGSVRVASQSSNWSPIAPITAICG